MPILFAILGQRLRLKMMLAEAPLHVFVKFTDDHGHGWNLETTSGAGFARDSHYRKLTPMSDQALASGLCLRGLTREETIGLMATELVDQQSRNRRFEDAIVIADVILKHAPKSAYVMVKRGSAYAGLLGRDIIGKYRTKAAMSPDIRAYADHLYQSNLAAFAAAEALGWRERDGQL
jgi:hypothetical protein